MKIESSHQLAQHLLTLPDLPVRAHSVVQFCEDGYTTHVMASKREVYDNEDMDNPRDVIILEPATRSLDNVIGMAAPV
jgi:hypothetical protein